MGKRMILKEKAQCGLRGHVQVFCRTPDGRQVPVFETKNVITYRAADMQARMLGNDQRYRPTYVGYLYGPTPSGSPMPNPSSTRDHTMADIESDLQALVGNMIISPLGVNPQFAVDGDPAVYDGNAITVSAISDSTSQLIYPSSGGYASLPPQAGSDAYYQVVLLSRYFEPGSTDPVFVPFARTQLASGTGGIVVQASSELVVFWTITFN
jgi:hypothetical protein